MTVVNKVIHRFIRERSEYEEGGALYNQIIPYNVQAYSYKLRDNGSKLFFNITLSHILLLLYFDTILNLLDKNLIDNSSRIEGDAFSGEN